MKPEHFFTINLLENEPKFNNNKLELCIYRKATNTDKIIHFYINHPHEHKIEAFKFYINRLLNFAVIERSKK